MENKKQIAVIGGGIAGLIFARCLSGEKFDVHVFEKKPDFGEIGAAISIFPNALCVLDEIGLLEEVLKNSGHLKKVFLKTSKGSILSISEPNYKYPTICMHRACLHKILMQNIPATLYTNYSLTSISHQDSGQILINFANGETKVFDAVIGADGIHSMVRQHIINDGKPIFRGYNIWRGVAQTNYEIGYGSETYGKGQRFGIVPVQKGIYGWWATCNESFMQDDKPENTKDKLNRLFRNWHHPIPELINNTEHILKNSLGDRVPKKGWTIGNVSLIGDAAHATTPNLGQGGCMAIEGAYILAKSVNKYELTKKTFKRYEELQFPRSKIIVNQSLKMGKLGQLSNPFLITLRNFCFKIMPSALVMKMLDRFFDYDVTKLEI